MTKSMSYKDAINKVTAFITYYDKGTKKLLVFKHPSGDIQVPAGTVKSDESINDAVLREIHEETGLKKIELINYIGEQRKTLENNYYIILKTTKVFSKPDNKSFDWAQLKRGIPVEKIREKGNYSHVNFEEYDHEYKRNYINYKILGWVPNDCLTKKIIRHFYHFKLIGIFKKNWIHYADQQYYEFFWIDFDKLQIMRDSMLEWIEFCKNELKYDLKKLY